MTTDVTNSPRIAQLGLGAGHQWVKNNGDCLAGDHSYVDCVKCHVVPFYTCFHDLQQGVLPDPKKINPKAMKPCKYGG